MTTVPVKIYATILDGRVKVFVEPEGYAPFTLIEYPNAFVESTDTTLALIEMFPVFPADEPKPKKLSVIEIQTKVVQRS